MGKRDPSAEGELVLAGRDAGGGDSLCVLERTVYSAVSGASGSVSLLDAVCIGKALKRRTDFPMGLFRRV